MSDSIEKLIEDMHQWCRYDGASAEQNVTVWASRLEALCREPVAKPVIPEPRCSDDPKAVHGFDRTASHSMGRYVCDCENGGGE